MSQPKTLTQRITHLLNSTQAKAPGIVAIAVVTLDKDGQCQVKYDTQDTLQLLLLNKVFELQINHSLNFDTKKVEEL